jgi:thiamine-phosphate pyrophosphorylase
MRPRQPLPKIWLMTDPRMGDFISAIARLPRGSGIVFRHYDLPNEKRRRLFAATRRVARARGHVIILADSPLRARSWGADGAHNRSPLRSYGLRTMAVHNAREAALAKRMRADLIVVSPVFATRSHPDARTLGRIKLGSIARGQRAIAMGGMTAKRFRSLSALKIYGWAGIDAFRT